MELPKSTDSELQLELLRAIALCQDSVAVAEELRPVVEKALSLIVTDDQKDEWANLISWTLINMRDTLKWLTSPFYEKGVQGNTPGGDDWIRDNKPGFDQHQRIWKIAEEGKKILTGEVSVPPERSKKSPTNRRKDGSEPGGKIEYDEAGQIMFKVFQQRKCEFSESDLKILRESRESIINSIMNRVSAEDAFSIALKRNTV